MVAMSPATARAQPQAGGQDRWAALREQQAAHWTNEEGLPQAAVTALAQDSLGFLWVGTQGGLARFDGQRFRAFTADPGNPDALPDGWVTTLFVDRQGDLWVGTAGGAVLRHLPDSGLFARLPGTPEASPVTGIAEDGDGRLFVGTRNGLLVREQGSAELSPVPGALGSRQVLGLAWTGERRLLVGTAAGLFRQTPQGAFVPVDGPWRNGGLEVAIAPPLPEGQVWGRYVRDSTMTLFRLDASGVLAGSVDLPEEVTRRVAGNLAAASLGDGRTLVYPGSGTPLLLRDGKAPEPAVPPWSRRALAETRALLRDRSGLVWVGSSTGLRRINPANAAFAPLRPWAGTLPDGAGGEVTATLPWQGGLLVAVQGVGINHLDPIGGLQPLLGVGRGGLPAEATVHRLLALDDAIVAATDRGLFRFVPGNGVGQGTGEMVGMPGLGPGIPVNDVARLGNTLYVATAGRGVWVTDTGLSTGRPLAESLRSQDIQALHADPGGRLWIGGRQGFWLFRQADGVLAPLPRDPADPSALPPAPVTAIATDGEGRLWVGTQGAGVAQQVGWKGNRPLFRRLDRASGFPLDGVADILPDCDGKVWVAGDGLARIDPATLETRRFGRDDGVPGRALQPLSASRTGGCELAFGQAGGVLLVRPDQVGTWAYQPPVLLLGAWVDGRPAPPGDRLTLLPGSRGFEVEFAALDYAGPGSLRYRHRLEGFDPDWVPSGAERRRATYTNLSPGDYRLRVEATNKDGIWSPAALTLAVRVLPAWYQTAQAQVAGTLLGSGLLAWLWVALSRRRTLALVRRKRELEALVAQSTTELRFQAARLAAANTALVKVGDLGREVAASLELEEVCRVLHERLAESTQVDIFGVALLDRARQRLSYVYYMEHDHRESPSYPLDHPTSLAARCLREGAEVMILDGVEAGNAPQHTLQAKTVVFRPLVHQGQTYGCITIQSQKADAFDEQALEMFRSAATFAAGAIANALAFGRVEAAEAAIRSLMDNVDQGLLTIGPDLAVGDQCSAACAPILGRQPAGRAIDQLLYPGGGGQAADLRATLASIFRETRDFTRQLKLGLLPTEFMIGKRTVQAVYKWLPDTGRLMLVLSDVTENRILAEAVERERRRLEMIVLAVSESREFIDLVQDYQDFITRQLPGLIAAVGDGGGELEMRELYRRIHTYKGLLNQFSFQHSPRTLHQVEERLAKEKDWNLFRARFVLQPERLTTELEHDLSSIESTLGEGYLRSGGVVNLPTDRVRALEEMAHRLLAGEAWRAGPPELRRLLLALVDLRSLDLRASLSLHVRAAQALAERLEKDLAPIYVQGESVLLPPDRYADFLRSLVHVFRNAVDHGIESPDERLEAGKPAAGHITCSIRDVGNELELSIGDDGRGIDRAALEGKLAAVGLDAAGWSLADLVFHEGLSSRDQATEISGRGIGLAAVRAELERVGGRVMVSSEPGQGTLFLFHIPQVRRQSDPMAA